MTRLEIKAGWKFEQNIRLKNSKNSIVLESVRKVLENEVL